MPKHISRFRTRANFAAATAGALCVLVASGDIGARTGLAQGAAIATPPGHDKAITHVLNRLGFGPRPGDVGKVRQIGLEKYIDQQLHPERIPDAQVDTRLATFTTLKKSSRELAEEYYLPALMERRERQRQQGATPAEPGMRPTPPNAAEPGMAPEMKPDSEMKPNAPEPGEQAARRKENIVLAELSGQRMLRAVYSERQLEEVLVDFWFNHFNVFAGKGQTRLFLTEYERDAIRPHVMGSFRDLLGATAKSPAMLFYLDNWLNTDPDGPDMMDAMRRRRMQQRPEMMPQQPGAPQQGTGERPRLKAGATGRRRGLNENYARELMELHTLGVGGGYTQKDVVEVARAFTGWTIQNPRAGGSFRFEPRLHDDKEKVVLGHTIGGGGARDGEQVLDILAAHPSTARFIATKLARRLVSDAPPQALVDRAAARFLETKGDIREVVRTIVRSEEFFAPAAYRAKVKSPFEFVASAVRVTGADVVNAMPLVQALRSLGAPLYFSQPPTGYGDTAETWVNTGTLLNRMNFAVSLVNNQWRGVRVDLARLGVDGNQAGARETLVATVLGGDASAATEDTLKKGTAAPQMEALAIGAPEFQRR